MTATDQIRKWYHRDVVLNHDERGQPGYHPHCNHAHPTVEIPREGGGVWVRPAHPFTTEAFNAYIAVMIHHRETMPEAGGLGHCRNIGGKDWPSLHAYLCAIDLPPNSRKRNAFVIAAQAIRTKSGARVFRTLSGDRMHDQIDCSPTALASGIDWSTVAGSDGTVPPPTNGDDVEEVVKGIQRSLNSSGYKGANGRDLTVDGIWGVNTEFAYTSMVADAASGGGGLTESQVRILIAQTNLVP